MESVHQPSLVSDPDLARLPWRPHTPRPRVTHRAHQPSQINVALNYVFFFSRWRLHMQKIRWPWGAQPKLVQLQLSSPI